jgi:hypothetical protein
MNCKILFQGHVSQKRVFLSFKMFLLYRKIVQNINSFSVYSFHFALCFVKHKHTPLITYYNKKIISKSIIVFKRRYIENNNICNIWRIVGYRHISQRMTFTSIII